MTECSSPHAPRLLRILIRYPEQEQSQPERENIPKLLWSIGRWQGSRTSFSWGLSEIRSNADLHSRGPLYPDSKSLSRTGCCDPRLHAITQPSRLPLLYPGCGWKSVMSLAATKFSLHTGVHVSSLRADRWNNGHGKHGRPGPVDLQSYVHVSKWFLTCHRQCRSPVCNEQVISV